MKKTIFVLLFGALSFGVSAQNWTLSGNANITASNFLGTTDCNYLIFKTQNAERMRLLKDKSFLGIGTTIPVASLHIHYQTDLKQCLDSPQPIDVASGKRLLHLTTSETGGNIYNGFSVLSAASKDVCFKQNEQAKIFLEGPGGGVTVLPNGNVGVGIESPVKKFHVQGDSYINGNVGIGKLPSSVKLDVLGDSRVNGSFWIEHTAFTEWNYASGVFVNQNYTKALSVHKGSTGNWQENFVVYGNGVVSARSIYAEKMEIRTDALSYYWPDYVFATDYELRSLNEVAVFIEENQHLPEVPSAAEVAEKGIDVGEMNTLLLKKVEELTLYIIQQQKEIDELKQAIK